jgi:hypothetical protein
MVFSSLAGVSQPPRPYWLTRANKPVLWAQKIYR